MDDFLDEFFQTREFKLQKKFPRIRGHRFILCADKEAQRENIGDNMKRLFEDVSHLSEKVYMQFSDLSKSL